MRATINGINITVYGYDNDEYGRLYVRYKCDYADVILTALAELVEVSA